MTRTHGHFRQIFADIIRQVVVPALHHPQRARHRATWLVRKDYDGRSRARTCLLQQENMRSIGFIQTTVAAIAEEVRDTIVFVLLEAYMTVSFWHLCRAKVGQEMTTGSLTS